MGGTHWRLVEIADTGVPVAQDRLERVSRRSWRGCFPGWYRDGYCALLDGPGVTGRSRAMRCTHSRGWGMRTIRARGSWSRRCWIGSGPTAAGTVIAGPMPGGPPFTSRQYRPLALRSTQTSRAIPTARHAAQRTAELLLEHRLFRSAATGEPIHPSWVVLHYPAYWHYDVLQGLRLLAAVGGLSDPRAADALALGCTSPPSQRSASRAGGGHRGASRPLSSGAEERTTPCSTR